MPVREGTRRVAQEQLRHRREADCVLGELERTVEKTQQSAEVLVVTRAFVRLIRES